MRVSYAISVTLSWIASKVIFGTKRYGQENVPKQGGFILASNHISLYDPPMAGSMAPRELGFFAKAELFDSVIGGILLRAVNSMPVRREGVDRQAIIMAVKMIKDGIGLTFYPEGTRSKTNNFLSPKPGVGLIAMKAACPIVPVYISGFNRPKDCLKRKIRGTVSFGEPFSAEWVMSHTKGKDGYLEIATAVMERIAEIKATSPIVKYGQLSAE